MRSWAPMILTDGRDLKRLRYSTMPSVMIRSMHIIGLTGGIGTGKSTAARILMELGIQVIDADQLAREAVTEGSPILQRVIDHFGSEILDETGTLDRRYLGRKVFADPAERQWLEQQIHPYVQDQMTQWIHQISIGSADESVICLMIPLLFEAQMTDWATEIWVVKCSEQQQLQRLRQRDHLSNAEIKARIASQWPLSEKIQRADVVLDNSGSLEQLRKQIWQALSSEQSS